VGPSVPLHHVTRGRRTLRRTLPLLLLAVAATGCDTFGAPDPITKQAQRAHDLWVGACLAALVVGVFVWALIGFAVVRYRKRSESLPPQVRYNLPVEVLYTVVPFVIVMGLFYYTARDEDYIDKVTKHPQVTVQAVGFRWSWQFNYLSDSPPNHLISVTGTDYNYPTLVLPEHETVLIELTASDVIHEFWVPQMLFNRQNIPGFENQVEVTFTKTGDWIGHCAQLCGTYHDRMSFYLKVVPPAQYQSYIAKLRAAALAAAPSKDTQSGAVVTAGSAS
jgi:cytochrome c oxidase subunit 2